MTVQEGKPQSLVYHIHSFHVLDIKVFTIIILRYYSSFLFSRYVSALTLHLELQMKSCLAPIMSTLRVAMLQCLESLYLVMTNLLVLVGVDIVEIVTLIKKQGILSLDLSSTKTYMMFKGFLIKIHLHQFPYSLGHTPKAWRSKLESPTYWKQLFGLIDQLLN